MSKPNENAKTPSAAAEKNRYFNQYANGIGYLNGIREFGNDGKPVRYAAQISVLQGPVDDVHYEYHDLVVSSEAVLGALLEHREAIEVEDANVLIRFNMANPRAKAFIYKQGNRAGELGASIGGFLTRIHSMKINGALVYEDRRTFEDQSETSQAVNT